MSAVMSRAGEASGKRGQVLDAAQACFVRHGLHRASMNDIAREAAMSAANLYRYFDSKEALIVGLAEREAERAGSLLAALKNDGDARAQLLGIVDQHFLGLSREAAVMRVELWAESTRNPAIAAVVQDGERACRDWFGDMFAKLATSPDCDPDALYTLINPHLHGTIVALATMAGYDPAPACAYFCALLDAGLAGRLPGARREACA